jgi:Lrp/AsnC family transcriptional regulator for asnA, asnC and gidA
MELFTQLDYQIMALLAEDGRISCAEMGRRLNQPARTIRYRLETLLQTQTLQVQPIINPDAFGYKILADVLIEAEAGTVLTVAQAAAKLDQVSYVACATGDRDVSLQVVAADVDSLYQFITEKLHAIPGVRRTQTILLPIKIKDVYQWQPPNPFTV